MKQYDIPLHTQADGSEDCGPVSATMILDFFGITSDEEEVIKKVPRSYLGTSSFEVAVVLMSYGLRVRAITANPLIFDGDFIRSVPDSGQIHRKVKEAYDKEKNKDKKSTAKSVLRYLDKRGEIIVKIPAASDITGALDEGKLVFASAYARAIGEKEGGYHFIVIGGYDGDKFLIFNPLPKSRRKSWERIDEVMFAIHASTNFDYDNGSILLVGK